MHGEPSSGRRGSVIADYTIRGSRIDDAGRLLIVDSLLEVGVKKSVLHIKLVDRPGT